MSHIFQILILLDKKTVGIFLASIIFFSNCFDNTFSVDNIQVIDYYMKFSDHLPVMLTLSGDVYNLCVTANTQLSNSVK